MLHDILPHQFNNQYFAGKIVSENDYILIYHENSLLLKSNENQFELPRKKDFPEISDLSDPIFLFTLDECACFLIGEQPKIDRSEFVYKELSFFREVGQVEIAWAMVVGHDLKTWYKTNQFCGTCGSPTRHKSDERALECTYCHTLVFPKISPAIIVAIVCRNKILLARNVNFRAAWYSLIAGYADIGESIEQTVIREVREEVGLDVSNIRYFGSQPWPLSGSMMIGFVAEADDRQPICIDQHEITEAAWFCRGNLPAHPSSSISIAGEMIEQFEQGRLL